MNIREAILHAADHIERNPRAYQFDTNSKPKCGTPGCLLGWIGHFAGIEATDDSYMDVVAKVIGHEWMYMGDLADELGLGGYTVDAKRAASVLRAYADRHHPAPKPGIPESVRAIFTTEQTEPV